MPAQGRIWRILTATLVAGVLSAAMAQTAAAAYPVPWTVLPIFTSGLTQPNSPPPGANDWSCQPSAAHPDPVVLVHGTFANMTVNWQTTSPLLANHGYCVFALNYGKHPQNPFPTYHGGGLTPMEESAAELSAFVDQVLAATGAAEVDIIGHSQGALMPGYYVKFLGGAAKVDDYIGVSGLWNGTNVLAAGQFERMADANPWAQAFSAPFRAAIDALCASCRQMVTGSDFLQKLNEGGAAVPGVDYTMIVTRNDWAVVPYTSGTLDAPNATNFVVQQQCSRDQADHLSIIVDPVAHRDILNALDPPNAKPVPCPVVLPGVGAPLFFGSL